MRKTACAMLAAALCAWAPLASAAEPEQAGMRSRTNGQNFKDRALAACIATAYEGSPSGKDASQSTGAFLEWTYFDLEQEPALDALIAKYLARTYVGSPEGYADARFELLKCIDLYHGPELEQLMHKAVPHPGWVGSAPRKPKH